ncbi:DsbA family protein [Candidatus Curtissbacteria bacterium]|nr:DsbA family protein [Candidatus Curtissbacteria bacterium]
MKTENKFFIGIGLVTLVAIIAAVFLLGREKPKEVASSAKQVDLISGAKHFEGSPEAKVKIVEFGDYQCPACGQAHPILKEVLAKNQGKIYFVFRNFPLSNIHANAKDSARAAEASGEQGKYFEMHDLLYENQKDWSELSNPKQKFLEYAKNLGLDISKFENDYNQAIGVINADYALGQKAGVESTPTFFINQQKYPGVIPADKLQRIIDELSK